MEGAVRVFAGEFNKSTMQRDSGDAGISPAVITPTGASCRIVFIAGALTEVVDDGEMQRCRLADPTGTFELVTGGRSSPCAETLRYLPIPSFITVTGQARMYRKNGTTFLSVRPEDVKKVDRAVRDQWVLTTAQHTLVRIGNLMESISPASGNVPADQNLPAVVRHYAVTAALLNDIIATVEGAVSSVRPADSSSPVVPQDARPIVLEILGVGTGPRGIAVEEIISQSAESGFSQEAVLTAIQALITEDECYQPQKGFLRLL